MGFAWFLSQKNKMVVKYLSFLLGIIWSYSIIKTRSVFNTRAGIIFKIFIANISWLTLIAACYYGYKNFSIKLTIFGVIISIVLVNIGFYFSKKFINQKFEKKNVKLFKNFFEYSLILWVIYYLLF
jgi:hypothetical protein